MLGNENKVCKLIKYLYGLKQEHKQWHQKFDEVVLSNGYLLNQADKCVYSKFNKTGKGVIICLYVDDMLIFGTDQVQLDLTKEFLSSRFSMKDMREADVILGIRINHKSNRIAISQSHYIEKVLKKFNYFNCTPVSTHMDTNEKLIPNNGQAVSQLEYSRVIDCLMYAMTCTRPDIAFAMGKLSRYTSNPDTQHWQAIQRVLKYLNKTIDYRLTYTGYPSVLKGYTDASWISNTEDNSSISGWVFLLGGGAISWASKKQTRITGSTMESEFVALAAAGKEAEWLKNLLLEIPLWSKPIAPISICCDSAATLAKVYSQMYNGKSRHLGVRHSMIRELITNRVISIEFVRSQLNLVDHLTKGLARDLVIKFVEGIELKHMYLHIIPRMRLDPAEKEDEVQMIENKAKTVVSQLEYLRVIDCLMYAMTCTRPDIAFVVDKLSKYTSNPGTQHWQAIQRVLKYLKKTMNNRLTYTGYPSVLEGYTDANCISNTKDNSSTSGWVFLLGRGAISWASKKQTCITGSTMKSEFMALAVAGKEAEWLKNLLLKITLWSKPIALISIHCDSVAILAKAYS
ncbi:zinc finger, CCHC-type containing protein [Tanacetum coccineum]